MPLDHAWAEKLLDAARERKIAFSQAEVKAIHSVHPHSPLATWAQHNLAAAERRLLSQEEVALWQHLEGSQVTPSTPDVDRLSIPTTDEEFQTAIASLNASTRSVERQSRILAAQSRLESRLASTENAPQASKLRHRQYFEQKQAAEVQHVKFANDQLFETLRADLQNERDCVSRDLKSAHAIVVEVLNAHGRALNELNETEASFAQPKLSLDNNTESVEERVAQLTNALRHFYVQAIKDRLDRRYLETLASSDTQASEGVSDDSVQAVQADLASLYAEIDDVATMLVSQVYSRGIESAVQTLQRRASEDHLAHTEQVCNKLSTLTATLTTLSERLESLQSRRLALHEINLQYQNIAPSTTINRVMRSHSGTVAACSQPATEDDCPAASALLRHFGFSSDGHRNTPFSLFDQVQGLVAKVSRQSAENRDQILEISARAVRDRRAALQSLSDALETHSAPDVDIEMRGLEERIGHARAEIEKTRPP